MVGVGSVIWQKLAESKCGLAESEIVRELGFEFSEMSRQQIERDVTKLLRSFEQKHLVDRTSSLQDLRTAASDHPGDSLFLFFNAAIRLLLCLRMHVLATVLAFVVVDLVLKLSGFKQLYNLVRQWPTAKRSVGPEVIPQMWGESSSIAQLSRKKLLSFCRMRLNFCVDTPVRAELLYAVNGVGNSQCYYQRPVTTN